MAGVFTISPDRSFVDSLATGILAEVGDTPQALLDYTILLPTRRACRALRDAFLRASDGTALLLPAMRPLGDVDEDGGDAAVVLLVETRPPGGRAAANEFSARASLREAKERSLGAGCSGCAGAG